MIKAEALSKTFNCGTPMQAVALRHVDLAIPEGQFVTVIGSNGAGKSTLLNLLTGDANVDTGRIAIDGLDVTRWSAPRRARLVARVFQNPLDGTCENLSIQENLALADSRGTRRGLGRALDAPRRTRFRDHLAALGLGLENRLDDRMGLLSGGERQAVSLLMATLRPSKILLLDEHTAALDPNTARLVMDLTETIVHDNGLTTLMVTHSMRQALDHGERTVMLHEGRVVYDVAGPDRAGLTVDDLLTRFHRARGEALDDDTLLLDA